MWVKIVSVFWAVAAMTLACAAPETAFAQPSPCQAALPASADPAQIHTLPLKWQCDGSIPERGTSSIAVRFDFAAQDDARYLENRNGFFDAVTLVSVREDSSALVRRHPSSTIEPQVGGGVFAIPLPATGNDVIAQYAIFDAPEYQALGLETQIVAELQQDRPDTLAQLLLVAMIAGFLLLPILLDLAFFRALQARFLLWHALLAFSMAAHLLTSGTLVAFVGLSIWHLHALAVGSFSLVVISCIMFFASFIEPDRLNPRIRQMLTYLAYMIVVVTIIRIAGFEVLRPYSLKLYFLTFLPVLGVIGWGVVDALRCKSRSVWFQAIAWAPLMAVGVIRLATMLIPELTYIEGIWMFRFGAVFEVIVTGLGVVDRVLVIRRERDRAQAHAAMLKNLADHDPLTGLLNRRAIVSRFDALADEGFNTVAVIDLDHFKGINDTHGHSIGDEVLRAVAIALKPDEDTLVVRLGGEEFALFMRGRNTIDRAEQRRQEITRHVSRSIALDRLVTASMGIIHAPEVFSSRKGGVNFDMIYQRADKLLYEAKATGRNRTVCERLKLFNAHPKKERRRHDRRAAA